MGHSYKSDGIKVTIDEMEAQVAKLLTQKEGSERRGSERRGVERRGCTSVC